MPQSYADKVYRRSAGTLPSVRKALPWNSSDFRILSMDGGGIRGILPASVLAECEDRFTGGRSAGDYFDLISGTSTGGIIALGLAIGLSAKAVLRLYLENGSAIFPRRWYQRSFYGKPLEWWDNVKAIGRYRYERAPLEQHLRQTFGNKILGDSLRRLVIPSFDGYTEVHLFKTPHHPDYQIDWVDSLVDVALATSAAPTFFSVYRSGERQFADGGVWANNPVMAALVDALVCFQINRRQVSIVSLGCVESEFKFNADQVNKGGLWHWREIMSSAMHLQSQNALGQAGLLIGRDQLLRVDASPIEPPIKLDDYERSSAELPDIARRLVDEHEESLSRFFDTPRAPFAAFHGPRSIQS